MAELKNDDLLLVNRVGETYTAPGEAIYASYLDKPEIGNFSLVESNPGVSPRFTDQEFVATLTMTEEGQPVSKKTFDAYVEGRLLYKRTSTNSITATTPVTANWEQRVVPGQTSNQTFSTGSVVYGGNQFVTAGREGYIATSPDSVTWTKQPAIDGRTNITW